MHENVVKIPDISLELIETWSLNKELILERLMSHLVIAIMKLILVFSFSGNRMATYT